MTTPLSKISESIDSSLYEKDYYLWLKNTANLLREKNLAGDVQKNNIPAREILVKNCFSSQTEN